MKKPQEIESVSIFSTWDESKYKDTEDSDIVIQLDTKIDDIKYEWDKFKHLLEIKRDEMIDYLAT